MIRLISIEFKSGIVKEYHEPKPGMFRGFRERGQRPMTINVYGEYFTEEEITLINSELYFSVDLRYGSVYVNNEKL